MVSADSACSQFFLDSFRLPPRIVFDPPQYLSRYSWRSVVGVSHHLLPPCLFPCLGYFSVPTAVQCQQISEAPGLHRCWQGIYRKGFIRTSINNSCDR